MIPTMEEQSVRHSDFSIDHILNRAGNNVKKNRELNLGRFQWLECSRYCPPKVPRISRKDGYQKRQLGRHPRIPFTSYQLSLLEQKFKETPYLSSEEVTTLSMKLNLADIRVKIWFQNRRARERREKNGVFKESNVSSMENGGEKYSSNPSFDVGSFSEVEDTKVITDNVKTEQVMQNPYVYANSVINPGIVPFFLPVMRLGRGTPSDNT